MAEQPCIIGKKIMIRGNISGTEDLAVEGRIEGTIALSHRLTVECSGVVEADLDVEDLIIDGTFQGNARASQTISISATAKVVGTIQAPRLIIEDGARFKGRVEMDVPLPTGLTQD